jgi:hypothetical protein
MASVLGARRERREGCSGGEMEQKPRKHGH